MPKDIIIEWLSWFHAQFPLVGYLMLMIALDVTSGLVAACVHKQLNSAASFNGMMKKAQMLIIIAVCRILDPYCGDFPLSKMCSMFFLITEAISVIENARLSGVPIPEFLGGFLHKKFKESPPEGPSSVHVDIHNERVVVHPSALKETESAKAKV